MKALKLTALAACLLVGGLAVASGSGSGSSSQFGGSVINMGHGVRMRGVKCGLSGGAVLCAIPTANTCVCRSATFPLFGRGGVLIGMASVCLQYGLCP